MRIHCIGFKLKELRIKNNLSLRDVQRLTNISNSYISQIEKGKRKSIGIILLLRFADVYGIDGILNVIRVAYNRTKNKRKNCFLFL